MLRGVKKECRGVLVFVVGIDAGTPRAAFYAWWMSGSSLACSLHLGAMKGVPQVSLLRSMAGTSL